MLNPFGSDVSMIEQLRIIADAMVPVLDAFRRELGAERADAIAGRGLAEWRRRLARAAAERVVGTPEERWEKATADALDQAEESFQVTGLSEERDGIRFAVSRCRVAELFRELGEPRLGYELACAHDLAQTEALAGDAVRLVRQGTLMRGAPACDFHYRFTAAQETK